jgi:hypothetical protein
VLILAGTVLALLLVPVLGGRLRRLADVRLTSRWLVPYALALQVLAISIVPDWPRPAVVALHASSYVIAAVFVWLNLGVPGVPLLAAGAACNALAIAVNGGQMPASPSALAKVGIEQEAGRYVNSGVVDDPRLGFLGDVFASPSWLPLQNVYSFGDLLILRGAVWLVHRTCGTVISRRPRCAECGAAIGASALRERAAELPPQRTPTADGHRSARPRRRAVATR